MEPGDRPSDPRLVSLALAAFASALYLALVIAAFGLISLATDTDVIDIPGQNLLLGPTMVGSALIVVAVRLAGVAARHVRLREIGGRIPTVPLGGGALTGLAAFLVYIIVGGMLRSLAARDGEQLLLFPLHELLRPYAWALGALALLVHVLFAVVLAYTGDNPGRPRWPWEK